LSFSLAVFLRFFIGVEFHGRIAKILSVEIRAFLPMLSVIGFIMGFVLRNSCFVKTEREMKGGLL
jgi:hypothetical protein